MYGYVYKVTNKKNKKIYIGQRKGDFDPNYYGSGVKIKRMLQLLGKENFTLEKLDEANSQEELDDLETKYILENNALDDSVGMNSALGGKHSSSGDYKDLKQKKYPKIESIIYEGVEYDTNRIYETTDYLKFNFHKENRDITTPSHKLKQGLYLYSNISPIVVNEKFEIVEGQHRLVAAESLGIPIRYIIYPTGEDTKEVIIMLNNTQKEWSVLDYIKSYAEEGLEDFMVVLNRFEKYGSGKGKLNLKVTTLMGLLTGQPFPTMVSKYNIAKNKFKVYSTDRLDDFVKYTNELLENPKAPKSITRYFTLPFGALMSNESFNFETFKNACIQDEFKTVKSIMDITSFKQAYRELLSLYHDYASQHDKKNDIKIEETHIMKYEVGNDISFFPKIEYMSSRYVNKDKY